MGKVIKTVFISGLVLWGILSLALLWMASEQIEDYDETIEILRAETPLKDKEVYNLINEFRKDKDVDLLVWDETLCPLADLRRRQIDQVYTHAQFENSEADKEFQKRPELAGLAENIHSHKFGFLNRELAGDWYRSEAHREAILNPKHTHTCISVDPYSAVQIFASYK